MDSEGMTMVCVAKSHLNIYTVGNPLIINRSSYSLVCMHIKTHAHTHKHTWRMGTKHWNEYSWNKSIASSYLEAKQN